MRNESSPLVSVCIPSFNAEGVIRQCLDAVLAQDLSNAEVVLVDNHSTDQTVAVAADMLTAMPNARIVENERNIGRVANWNRCFELARGKYVKFAFTNDAMLPGGLQELLRVVEADDEIVVAGSRALAVKDIPEPLPPVRPGAASAKRTSADALEYFATDGFEAAGSLNGMIYRRSVVVEGELWFREDMPYFADFVQALEMAAVGPVALLDAETFCFNHGAVGRYHYAGQENPKSYLSEYRRRTDRHMELLRRNDRDSGLALRALIGRYYWYLSQGWSISPADAFHVFQGQPRTQWGVAARTTWFRVKQRLGSSGR